MSILPTGVVVVEGQDNRVPEPLGVDFVVMTPIRRERLSTTGVLYADVAFHASALNGSLSVIDVVLGTIVPPCPLFGPSSANVITGQTSGPPGGPGAYTLDLPMSSAVSLMAAGQAYLMSPHDLVYQLDFHSADITDAADMVQTVSTLFRSEYANGLFNSATTGAWPLYADDPVQAPFINAERQYESRWTLDVHIQTNQSVPWPQQFLDQAVTTIRAPADSPNG